MVRLVETWMKCFSPGLPCKVKLGCPLALTVKLLITSSGKVG